MATPSPVTLLWGEDAYSLKATEDALIAAVVDPGFKAMNLNVLDGPSTPPSQAAAAAATMPFGLGGRLVLVRDCPYFSAGKGSADDVQVLVDLIQKGLPPGCHLALSVSGNIDKRLSQTKAILEHVTLKEFPGAKPWDSPRPVVEWLMGQAREGGIKLGNDLAEDMVASFGSDRWKLANELAKLATYADGQPITPEMLVSVGSPGETDVFAVLAAVGDRDAVAAVTRLRKLLVTEAPLRVLAAMATTLRNWLQIRLRSERGMSATEIAKALGAKSSFKIEKDLEKMRRWNARRLQRALPLLLETDVALKTGSGRQYEAMQFEKLLVQLAVDR